MPQCGLELPGVGNWEQEMDLNSQEVMQESKMPGRPNREAEQTCPKMEQPFRATIFSGKGDLIAVGIVFEFMVFK